MADHEHPHPYPQTMPQSSGNDSSTVTSSSNPSSSTPVSMEIPDMVPVSIRTTLPEFQHCSNSLEKVLAGVLLTWEEFLNLFDIRPTAEEYFIRGRNGLKHDLGEKIADYVNSFKKKLKIYPVSLERVTPVDNNKAQQSKAETAADVTSNERDVTVDERSNEASALYYDGPTAKKQKLIDADKRKKHNRKPNTLMEDIAQNIVHSQPVIASTFVPTTAVNRVKKKPGRKPSVKPESSSYSKDIFLDKNNPSDNQSEPLNVQMGSSISSSDKAKQSQFGNPDHQREEEMATTTGGMRKRGRKPKQKAEPIEETRRSSRASKTTKESDSSDESSESEHEEVPSKDKKKLLKEQVIQYLTKKVSPRAFMRLRNELMSLREQEKYFKVTSVVPMTAGMMEQTFCRKINHKF